MELFYQLISLSSKILSDPSSEKYQPKNICIDKQVNIGPLPPIKIAGSSNLQYAIIFVHTYITSDKQRENMGSINFSNRQSVVPICWFVYSRPEITTGRQYSITVHVAANSNKTLPRTNYPVTLSRYTLYVMFINMLDNFQCGYHNCFPRIII